MDFKGKVVLITGGANGIGQAAAAAFAERGAKIVVVDRDVAAGEKLAQSIRGGGGVAGFIAADVSQSADVQAYVKHTMDTHGRIDCFFNNAGIEGKIAPTQEYDEAMFDMVIAVNLRGIFLGLRHVLPVMIAQGSGAVVNTASVGGLIATAGMPAYIASKHAVLGLTKTAAGDVARHGVRVNAICPGPVDTRMIHSIESQLDPSDPVAVASRYVSSIPSGRYSSAEEVANIVLFLCSDMAANVIGAHYVIDGGRSVVGGIKSTKAEGAN